MINFNNTTFFYDGKPLIQDFSLDICRGDKVVLYGPSGSGKTTLLHAVLGFVNPDFGSVSVLGKSVSPENINYIRSLTSWLPQDLSLPYSSVRDMVYAPFEFRANKDLRPSEDIILSCFDRLGLEHDLLNKQIIEISGGQKQRILLLTTTLLRKPVLLIDEPTSALDPDSVLLTIDFLKSLDDVTMIAVSHDSAFTDAFSNKVFIPKL